MLKMTDCGYYQAIKDYPVIMVFGAARNGWTEQQNCEWFKRNVSCYLVSNPTMTEFHGVPVKQINEVSSDEKRNGLVIVGRAYENHEETVQLLRENGFCHIIPGINQSTHNLNDFSEEQIAQLKAIFGDNLLLHIPALEKEQECNVRIYAATSTENFHTANRQWKSKYIEYIQTGAARTKERICTITDDTGDNISKYNRYLNDTVAGYWIAKNDTQHDYLGLFHYSRGMDLSDRQIEWIAENDIDVVLKMPETFKYDILSFSKDAVYKTVCKFAPDYRAAAEWHLNHSYFFQGNIQISKSRIFKEYYEWAINMLKGMKELYPDAIASEERFFAYAMETWTNVWYIKNASRFRFAFAPSVQLYDARQDGAAR